MKPHCLVKQDKLEMESDKQKRDVCDSDTSYKLISTLQFLTIDPPFPLA